MRPFGSFASAGRTVPGVLLAGLATLGLLCFAGFASPSEASALPAEVGVSGFEQQDLDGDGSPDLAVIAGAFASDADRVLVFDGGADMKWSDKWEDAVDTANDTWVFDIGADGISNLIIRFERTEGGAVAYLYDDVDGDGAVGYRVEGKRLTVTESPHWSMRVSSADDWISQDGHPSANLQVLIDRPVRTEQMSEDLAERYMPHDGKPDMAVEVADPDGDGVPDYVLTRLLSQVPTGYGVGRSTLSVNVGRTEPRRSTSAPFWPFLSMRDPAKDSGGKLRYFDVLSNVAMDWAASTITGFLLPGYPIESGYHVSSLQYLQKGQVNDTDYEMPQAYYDLAGDRDGNPELHIRLFSPAPLETGATRWQEMRYSWNQSNLPGLAWQYKLGLMGDNEVDDVVSFPDFELKMIPYERLPYWTTEHQWKLATFVATEGAASMSSEGIYDWSPWSGVNPVSADNPSADTLQASLAYLEGRSDTAPYQYFQDIREGLRGEYNFSRPLAPLLYLSPVDRRLHLKGAEYGLANLGSGRYVRYRDCDGDGYLDQWVLLDDGQEQREIDRASGSYLLYFGDDSLSIKKIGLGQALFETPPPRDHGEWLSVGDKLADVGSVPKADDFRSMFGSFQVPETNIVGAKIRDYRPTENGGFRFVLDLEPGFGVQGPDHLGALGMAPGSYAVEYDGAFSVARLTPPHIEVSVGAAQPTELATAAIAVTARNQGLQDEYGASLQLWAQENGGPEILLGSDKIDLLAEDVVMRVFQWTPPASGGWTLTPRLVDPDGQSTSFPPAHMLVLPTNAADPALAIGVSAPFRAAPALILMLVASACLATTVFWREGPTAHEGGPDAPA